MNIRSEMSYCQDLSYFSKEHYAGDNYQKVYYYIKNNYTDINPNDLLIPTIFTCIAADGKLSETEWKFIASFIGGYSYDEAFATAGEFYCEEAKEVVRKLAQTLPGDIREAFVKVCIAVVCVDDTVRSDEIAFIESIAY